MLLAAAGIPATPKERRKVATMLRLAGRLAPYASRNRVKLTATPKRRRRTFGFMIADPAKVPADLAPNALQAKGFHGPVDRSGRRRRLRR